MPRSTISEPYQHAMLAAAGERAEKLTGDEANGFLLLLGPDHDVIATYVYGDQWVFGEERRALIAGAFAAILYDPFDFPEYGWMQWHNLPREIFESVVGPLYPHVAEGYQHTGSFMA